MEGKFKKRVSEISLARKAKKFLGRNGMERIKN
jgi:hypothetical protein